MTLSKSSPAFYLLLTLAISSWLELAEPTMAVVAHSRLPQMTDSPTAIASVIHSPTPLSQVRGDLARIWTNHGVGSPRLTRNANDGLKDLPVCACATCSGINRLLSPVG